MFGFIPADYPQLATGYVAFMGVLSFLRQPLRNDGWVDFGWPAGLVALAWYVAACAPGAGAKTYLLCGMYGICGLRMSLGWLERLRRGEDRRWSMWREKWSQGRGLFGVRSLTINFFVYYEAQALTTVLVLALPPFFVASAPEQALDAWSYMIFGAWLVFFTLENIADLQLYLYQRSPAPKPRVMDRGLWRYSRHPNYFCEFMLWVCYALYALPHATGFELTLLLVPAGAYWFLTAFTGIPMTEASSLASRGEAYRQYQARTRGFFPWWPRR